MRPALTPFLHVRTPTRLIIRRDGVTFLLDARVLRAPPTSMSSIAQSSDCASALPDSPATRAQDGGVDGSHA